MGPLADWIHASQASVSELLWLKSETDVRERGVLQRKVFPLCSPSAHRIQGVNLQAALKTEAKVTGGNSKDFSSLPSWAFHPAFPTQGIVNIGSQPPRPTAQNCPVLSAYTFMLFYGRCSQGALLLWAQRTCFCSVEGEESCPAGMWEHTDTLI